MSWFLQYRLDWIAETLRVFGYINRDHLVRKFEISIVQASNDLQRFQEVFPGQMRYDASAKRYTSTEQRGKDGAS